MFQFALINTIQHYSLNGVSFGMAWWHIVIFCNLEKSFAVNFCNCIGKN